MTFWQRLIDWLFPRPRPVPVPTPEPTPPGDVAAQLLAFHNRERSHAGLRPLRTDSRLVVAAAGHARRMAALGRMAHSGIGDGDPWSRILEAGYSFADASENLGWNERDAAEAVAAWMSDPPHRANVLGDFVDMGGAMARGADGSPYWCCDYGRP